MLLFFVMDPSIWSAIIAAAAAVTVNIISNVILSSRQTAILEYRIKQLEDALRDYKELPGRVTVLETQMNSVQDALKEMRLS